jgi:hypothetical protein
MLAWFAAGAVETMSGAHPGLDAIEPDRGTAAVDARRAGGRVRNIVVITAVALTAGCGASYAQTVAAAAQTVRTPQEQSVPAAGTAPASGGLSELDAMTFSCPKAGLNAAAREAAKVPSQGTYQFAYFRIVTDAHHAAYEVHFKSNYAGEADLKYCVAIYCQQGWDPKTTKATVTLLGSARQGARAAAHGGECAANAPGTRRLKR